VVRTKRAERLGEPGLVLVARLELALLDPERLRELRLVAWDLLDEALGVLAPIAMN